ncbi:MAG: tRNA (adenosine(37)-N6)-threonylcarbamoyltransferase complex ATPase subunit type 1 TsaE [Betaproteobacteria bacterium]
MSAGRRSERSLFLADDEEATLALGHRLARIVGPGLYVALSGHLGSGKTTLARGMLRGLGYQGKVKSPTYTLVELYNLSRLDLYHFDFYRFNDSSEWEDAGFRDYFAPGNICLVEWPERAEELLPAPDLKIELSEEDGGRRARIVADTERGTICLNLLPD